MEWWFVGGIKLTVALAVNCSSDPTPGLFVVNDLATISASYSWSLRSLHMDPGRMNYNSPRCGTVCTVCDMAECQTSGICITSSLVYICSCYYVISCDMPTQHLLAHVHIYIGVRFRVLLILYYIAEWPYSWSNMRVALTIIIMQCIQSPCVQYSHVAEAGRSVYPSVWTGSALY